MLAEQISPLAETAEAEFMYQYESSAPSATKQTLGSNWCVVHAVVDEANARLVAIGALDNLVKGAAGSAVQNLNVMCGMPETLGLASLPLWP